QQHVFQTGCAKPRVFPFFHHPLHRPVLKIPPPFSAAASHPRHFSTVFTPPTTTTGIVNSICFQNRSSTPKQKPPARPFLWKSRYNLPLQGVRPAFYTNCRIPCSCKKGTVMKFECEKTLLASAIEGVSRAITNRSAIPVLEGVYLKAEGFNLTLTGYDMEMGITTTIECNVLVPGETVLEAKLLLSLVSRMPAGDVRIELTDDGQAVISGR